MEEIYEMLKNKKRLLDEFYAHYEEVLASKDNYNKYEYSYIIEQLTHDINVLEVDIQNLVARTFEIEIQKEKSTMVDSARGYLSKVLDSYILPIKYLKVEKGTNHEPVYKSLEELSNDYLEYIEFLRDMCNDGSISLDQFNRNLEQLKMVMEYDKKTLELRIK